MTTYRHEHRWKCLDCGWVGTEEMKLIAPNPFHKIVNIRGCPQCKEVDPFEPLCDATECTETMSSSTPREEGGGLWTCWEHSPDNPKNQGKGEE